MAPTSIGVALLGTWLLAATQSPASPFKTWTDTREPPDGKLPMCGLLPAKHQPGLCVLKYRVTTQSPHAQAFFDQGLAYFYSYVWMEAARSFETACQSDPDCALAWWGLSRALEQYRRPHVDALKKAQALMAKASHREQLLIQARLEEKGMWPNVGNAEARLKAAIKTVDTLLTLYDDDEEGWYYRAQLTGGSGFFGGQVSSAPFYKALLRINPLHPGANHELVHYYENAKRPALGWPYAEKYIESSPGIPHAFHMQAHLATRIGRWDKTTDRSVKAIALQRAYHQDMKVKPSQDQQYAHHLETLMRGLIHDGRFAEARQLKKECQDDKIKHTQLWFRLHLAERDFDEAQKIANEERKRDKVVGSYMAALVHLKNNEHEQATPEAAVLEEALKKRTDKQTQLRFWEVQGILLTQQDKADEGLALLAKAVERTKADYGHHAWGNGAYHMQAWGLAALACHKYQIAEEAFLEALAHDAGCFHAALGLQVLCERLGRPSEAARYAEMAQRCWRHAAPSDLLRELEVLRADGNSPPKSGTLNEGAGQLRLVGLPTTWPAFARPGFDGEDPAGQPTATNPQTRAYSSLLPGERPGPYSSLVVTGQHRGTAHCFICETADKPAVIIFARHTDAPLGKLAAAIDKAAAKHADLRSWITFLHADHVAVDAKIINWSREHALGAVPAGVFEDVGGPPSYRLARDVDVTVLLFVKQKVVANFTFRPGELNAPRIDDVVNSIAEIVKK